jgi:hypothetical protein
MPQVSHRQTVLGLTVLDRVDHLHRSTFGTR